MTLPSPTFKVIAAYAAALGIGVGLNLYVARPLAARGAQPAPSAASPKEVLGKYCISCHNSRLKTAGLTLDTLDVDHVAGHEDVWEKVATKLRTHEMPPPGRPRPDLA